MFVVMDFLRKGDVLMVTRIGASERKGVAPWMIFVMRDGSLSPLRSFHLDNLG